MLYLKQKQKIINSYLEKVLPKDNSVLSKAIRYSVLGKGKRIRAILALASAEIFGTKDEIILPAAAALEMAHAFSLIHDDLPAMDNDDFRRGLPSTHIRFGEAQAILAGDALNTLAFETIASKIDRKYVNDSCILKAIEVLSQALGCKGMIYGQSLDLLKEGKILSKNELMDIYRKKTGALIRVSILIGALLSNANERELRILEKFGDHIGLAFQIKDDILDLEESRMELKKLQKMLAIEKEKALGSIKYFGNNAKILINLSEFIVNRDN